MVKAQVQSMHDHAELLEEAYNVINGIEVSRTDVIACLEKQIAEHLKELDNWEQESNKLDEEIMKK